MISIIVPVYNTKEYLPACVESLLGQTDPDVEIILVDDGSTDGCGALCDSYALRDSRIRVIHKENGGLSSARNAGLDAAAGDWILFVDGDDYLAKTAVSQLGRIAQLHPDADFIQFLYQETDGSWSSQSQTANIEIAADVAEFFRRLYRMGGVAASACTKLFHRRIFSDLRFTEGIRHEDEDLMTRLLPLCRKAVYTDLVLYGYVMRPESIIRSGFTPKKMDIFPIMDRRLAVLEQLGCTELVLETQRRMFQTAVWLYCQARKSGCRQETAQLRNRILTGAAIKNLPLSGQYRLVHRLTGIFPAALDLYYLIRRITGKT